MDWAPPAQAYPRTQVNKHWPESVAANNHGRHVTTGRLPDRAWAPSLPGPRTSDASCEGTEHRRENGADWLLRGRAIRMIHHVRRKLQMTMATFTRFTDRASKKKGTRRWRSSQRSRLLARVPPPEKAENANTKMDSDSISVPLLKGYTGLILTHGLTDPLVVGHGELPPMILVTVLAGPTICADTSVAPPLGPMVNSPWMLAKVALLLASELDLLVPMVVLSWVGLGGGRGGPR